MYTYYRYEQLVLKLVKCSNIFGQNSHHPSNRCDFLRSSSLPLRSAMSIQGFLLESYKTFKDVLMKFQNCQFISFVKEKIKLIRIAKNWQIKIFSFLDYLIYFKGFVRKMKSWQICTSFPPWYTTIKGFCTSGRGLLRWHLNALIQLSDLR